MKTFLIGCVCLCLTAMQALAQPGIDSLWSQTYGGAGMDELHSVLQTSDGGYAVAGYTASSGAGMDDYWLIKTDADGNTIWNQTYGGSGTDDCYYFEQTSDGGYVLFGHTDSYGSYPANYWIVRTNANGDSLWSRVYGLSNYDYCKAGHQTSDGGYIMAGFTNSIGSGDYDYWLLKLDSNGDSLWSHTYGGSDYDYCYSVWECTDGGYVLAGFTASFGAGMDDFWLVKTNANGDSLWSQTYGGSGTDACFGVEQTPDGGYILFGYTDSYGPSLANYYIVKTDANGTQLWDQVHGFSDYDYGYTGRQTSDGGFIMSGMTNSIGSGDYDFWLLKMDSNGDSLWSRTFGGSAYDRCHSVQETSDRGYILGGRTDSYGAGGRDGWLVKTGPEYQNVGYVTLIQSGPPDWAYRLNWISGSLDHIVFTNFCESTIGSIGGDAAAVGWMAMNYADSIVFTTTTPLTSGTIDTFWLSHPYCSDIVNWTVGDSLGTVEGPLPVELTTFQAFAGNQQVTMRWQTASEQDNDHFNLYRRRAGQESLTTIAQIPGHGTTSEPHSYEYIDQAVQNGVTYEYQISDVDITGHETIHALVVSATPGRDILPIEYALYQNYPNPFNPTTTIRYNVKEAGLVRLTIFDLLGREITTLMNGTVSAGSYDVLWDASDLPSGIYLCRMEAEGYVQTQKLVLMK
ncbi:T9SS type A sorting domain-containing protein [bacterium]|nr:T9SS type A sorting domain-containing protein [bacterium]